MGDNYGRRSTGVISLKYSGATYATVDGISVSIAADEADGCLTVRSVDHATAGCVGARHRRLVLAVRRALSADAALRWKLQRGGFRLPLALLAAGTGHLAARLCLPHLMALEPLPLYPYQRRGVARLLRSNRILLADDMGLGKTIQAAATLRLLIASGRVHNALVVAPATLLPNWRREMAKWVPELVVTIGSPARHPRTVNWDRLMDQSHVVVVNYEDLRVAISTFGPPRADLLVLDEAHRVKNRESLTSRAVRQIDSAKTWALTGTPLERDSTDFTTLLALLDPNAFTRGDAKLSPYAVRARAARFVLRREKKDVLAELPPVIRRHERLSMGEGQRRAYRRIAAASANEHNLLRVFSRLRETCDYDSQTGESVKVDRIAAILQEIRNSGEKAVVFSYLLEPLRLLQGLLRDSALPCEVLVGSMDSDEREKAIRRFRREPIIALLASLRVASEGLTLVEANHVILLNRWWNPSLNQQAVDRVVRIGQTRRVCVHSFTVEGTVEDDLDRILEAKEELFDEMIGRLSTNSGSINGVLAELTGPSPAKQ